MYLDILHLSLSLVWQETTGLLLRTTMTVLTPVSPTLVSPQLCAHIQWWTTVPASILAGTRTCKCRYLFPWMPPQIQVWPLREQVPVLVDTSTHTDIIVKSHIIAAGSVRVMVIRRRIAPAWHLSHVMVGLWITILGRRKMARQVTAVVHWVFWRVDLGDCTEFNQSVQCTLCPLECYAS